MAFVLDRDSAGAPDWAQVKAGFWDSLAATRDETLSQNPLNELRRIDELGSANSVGDPTAPEYQAPTVLPAADARAAAARRGITLKIPEAGINEQALNILMARKQDEADRQKALTQGPQGFWPGAARLGTAFAASVLDPLNVASAFLPVLPEARIAAMLAERGLMARSFIRTGVGAVEGAAGQAVLEPLNLISMNQDQADYTMGDSLKNIAFGGFLGAGLHVLGGALIDSLGKHMPVPKPIETPAPIVSRETSQLSVAISPDQRANEIWARMRRGELSAEQVSALVQSEPDAMRIISESLTKGAPEVAPPFARLTPEAARARAVAELAPGMKADLLGAAGNRAAPGDVPALRAQVAQLEREVQTLQTDEAFKAEAKRQQEGGLSRKQAESAARKALADRGAEAQARLDAANSQIETNRQASIAEQQAAAIDQGVVLPQHEARVSERAAQILAGADIHAVFNPAPEGSARFQIGQTDWQTRQAAFKTALGQMLDGKQVNVEPVFGTAPGARTPMTKEQIAAAAERQQQPESARVADFPASKAADERLANDPKGEPLEAAEGQLAAEEARLRETLTNLGQSAPKAAAPAPHLLKEIGASALTTQAKAVLAKMYELAARLKPGFDSAVQQIADAVGGVAKLAELKKVPKTVGKILSDYKGEPTGMKDILRATVEIESVSQAQAAVAAIKQRFNVLESGQRNLLDPNVKPIDGYRDAKFNVLIDGHVAEVQVNLPEMLAAKKTHHALYDARQDIERLALKEDRKFTAAEKAEIDRLNAEMRAVYEPAWEAALSKSKNLASETGAPLRRAEDGSNLRGGESSQAAQTGTPGSSQLPSETGMPSTSKNTQPDSKVGSDLSMGKTSEPLIPENTPKSNASGAFQPSHEWQVVPPETVLPPGLDIRMSTKTGVNEARLKPGSPEARASQMLAELKPFDDAIKEADALGAGIKAAAMCGTRQ